MDAFAVYRVLAVMLAVPSLALNGLVILALLRRGTGWAIDVQLMFLIGVLDTMCAMFVFVLQIAQKATGSLLIDQPVWCTLSAIMCEATVVSAVVLAAMLSMARYLAIVRGRSLATGRWMLGGISAAVVVWLVVYVISLVDEPQAMPSKLYCFPLRLDFSAPRMLFFVLFLLIVLLPSLMVVGGCYSMLLLHLRRLVSYGEPSAGRGRLFLKIILVLFSYCLALLPELALLFKEAASKVPRTPGEDATVTLLLFSLTIVNAVFVLALHHETRQECRNILKLPTLILK
ncbi:hypothetical protein DSO57_1020681 [Entomophthora muscae]|uniref:Uncharacterized protein n=2 Tax=Entomophthora muscae TaxID=34485 RepID=A0ACC2U257_9FUNG|nr:hypothetical protein DSO57_1004979 [Entomophthora muscae]KAJ9080835.1 hypothetical protein DSO57_1020681 [Entomophthora muscae]